MAVGATSIGFAMILTCVPVRTVFAANDSFHSGADLPGAPPQPQSSTRPENTGTPEETVKPMAAWIQELQAKAANRDVEKAKQQGVKPAL